MNDERPTNGTDDTADESELRAALEPFATLLRTEAVWAEPPPGLEAAIVERIRMESSATRARSESGPSERALSELAPPEPIQSDVIPPVTALRRRRSWVAPALALAAAAVAFFGGFVVADRGEDDAVAIADVDLVGTDLAPDASASGDVVDRGAGYAIRLDMAGLPPAPEGEYYEGWLRAADGEMVSVGTFHMRGGDGSVVLWSGVKIAEYPTLLVTEQVERAGVDASERVVLEGPVDRR